MGDTIKARKGIKASIDHLLLGEFGFTTDEERVYIGGNNGNIPLPNAADLSEKANKTELLSVETGNWTGTLIGTVTSGSGISYGNQTGNYFKVGNTVTATLDLVLANKGTNIDGNLYITGLPYASKYKSSGGIGSCYGLAISDSVIGLGVQINPLENKIMLSKIKNSTVTGSNLTASDIANTFRITMQITYYINI